MEKMYSVKISTNFWNFSREVSASSKEAAVAQAMVVALHENHSVPSLKVKSTVVEESAKREAHSTIEKDYFNQAY